MFRNTFLFISLFFCLNLFSQHSINNFLKVSDTLNVSRRNAVLTAELSSCALGLVALNQLWYANYPKSEFHFINDNDEWLQMDKTGHFFSGYHLTDLGKQTMAWGGSSQKSQLIYGASLSFGFLTTVEIFDGFSANWGASTGDLLANTAGISLFLTQDLLWNEQRIVPKFSFHSTPYASLRPNVLGSNYQEQILKDYNGQTYWLSVNVASFIKTKYIPRWFNLAFGYGGQGMVTGKDALVNTVFLPDSKRYRQFYVSLDVDLTKIKTKSNLLKTIFGIINTVKIPAPTIEFSVNKGVKCYPLYF